MSIQKTSMSVILGAALLGLAKSKVGSQAKSTFPLDQYNFKNNYLTIYDVDPRFYDFPNQYNVEKALKDDPTMHCIGSKREFNDLSRTHDPSSVTKIMITSVSKTMKLDFSAFPELVAVHILGTFKDNSKFLFDGCTKLVQVSFETNEELRLDSRPFNRCPHIKILDLHTNIYHSYPASNETFEHVETMSLRSMKELSTPHLKEPSNFLSLFEKVKNIQVYGYSHILSKWKSWESLGSLKNLETLFVGNSSSNNIKTNINDNYTDHLEANGLQELSKAKKLWALHLTGVKEDASYYAYTGKLTGFEYLKNLRYLKVEGDRDGGSLYLHGEFRNLEVLQLRDFSVLSFESENNGSFKKLHTVWDNTYSSSSTSRGIRTLSGIENLKNIENIKITCARMKHSFVDFLQFKKLKHIVLKYDYYVSVGVDHKPSAEDYKALVACKKTLRHFEITFTNGSPSKIWIPKQIEKCEFLTNIEIDGLREESTPVYISKGVLNLPSLSKIRIPNGVLEYTTSNKRLISDIIRSNINIDSDRIVTDASRLTDEDIRLLFSPKESESYYEMRKALRLGALGSLILGTSRYNNYTMVDIQGVNFSLGGHTSLSIISGVSLPILIKIDNQQMHRILPVLKVSPPYNPNRFDTQTIKWTEPSEIIHKIPKDEWTIQEFKIKNMNTYLDPKIYLNKFFEPCGFYTYEHRGEEIKGKRRQELKIEDRIPFPTDQNFPMLNGLEILIIKNIRDWEGLALFLDRILSKSPNLHTLKLDRCVLKMIPKSIGQTNIATLFINSCKIGYIPEYFGENLTVISLDDVDIQYIPGKFFSFYYDKITTFRTRNFNVKIDLTSLFQQIYMELQERARTDHTRSWDQITQKYMSNNSILGWMFKHVRNHSSRIFASGGNIRKR